MVDLKISRQPIFGRDDQIRGSEIRYDPGRSGELEGEAATPDEVIEGLLGIGLDRLADGRLILLSAPREIIESSSIDLLADQGITLSIPSSPPLDSEYLALCTRLAGSGFRLAMDLGVLEGGTEFLPLLDILRVDLAAYSGPDLQRLSGLTRPYGIELLAERVGNTTLRDACLEAGFELFLGYDHLGPSKGRIERELPSGYLRIAGLMQRIRDIDASDSEIEALFRTDLSLSYKLLRLVNSAAIGVQGARSIGHAIRLLGRDTLYRWLAVLFLATTADNGLRLHLVQSSLMRARLSELLAEPAGYPGEADTLYLTGLLSLLDQLLDLPMQALIGAMGLTDEVRRALVDRDGIHGEILQIVEAYELGEWDEFSRLSAELGIETAIVGAYYLEALEWARALIASAGRDRVQR